jgi:hypothetical protein
MKLVLIGTSGAGKSACLELVGQIGAEMDRGLDTGRPQSAATMLDWMARSPARIIVMSVHCEGLKELVALKKSSHEQRIHNLHFVYLFCEKEVLERRIRSPGSGRSPGNIEGTMKKFDELNEIFKELMDDCIDTTMISSGAVAGRVIRMYKSIESTRAS